MGEVFRCVIDCPFLRLEPVCTGRVNRSPSIRLCVCATLRLHKVKMSVAYVWRNLYIQVAFPAFLVVVSSTLLDETIV